MIQRGDRLVLDAGTARLTAALRLKWALICTEVAVGSVDLARLGIIALALLIQSIVLASPGHFRPAPTLFMASLVTLGTALSLALSAAAGLPLRQVLPLRARRLLGITALVALALLSIVGMRNAIEGARMMVTATPYSNDGAVMDYYAAEQVLHGHNPYLQNNIVAALASMNVPATTVTPLTDGQFRGVRAYPSDEAVQQVFLNVLRYRSTGGVPIPVEFESKYNYPAGSFLCILPFVWAGMHNLRFLYALAVVAMGVYLWWRMPRTLRWLAPLVVLADVPLIILTRGAQPDPIYGLLLMLGFGEWRRANVSPLFLGLSAATKQLCWFFLPFYAILVLHRFGAREALRRSGIMALVYLVVNGPFIVRSPEAYLSSIAGPMSDPMFPMGIGVIALFVAGPLPLLPKAAFAVAELAAWASSTYAFWRLRLLVPTLASVLAAVPLFFAWRSLVNYFYLVPLLALMITLTVTADGPQEGVPA